MFCIQINIGIIWGSVSKQSFSLYSTKTKSVSEVVRWRMRSLQNGLNQTRKVCPITAQSSAAVKFHVSAVKTQIPGASFLNPHQEFRVRHVEPLESVFGVTETSGWLLDNCLTTPPQPRLSQYSLKNERISYIKVSPIISLRRRLDTCDASLNPAEARWPLCDDSTLNKKDGPP